MELLPTTHVKWLWENKRNRTVEKNRLKGFIIETEGHMYEFNAEKIVLDELKENFKKITLQSDFSDEYVLGTINVMKGSTSIRATMRRSTSASARITEKEGP